MKASHLSEAYGQTAYRQAMVLFRIYIFFSLEGGAAGLLSVTVLILFSCFYDILVSVKELIILVQVEELMMSENPVSAYYIANSSG